MKLTKTILSMAALMAVALVLQTPALAQSSVRADIPFAFEAAGHQFAPGVYTLQRGPAESILTLADNDGHRIMMLTNRGAVGRNLAVAFNNTGTGRSLAGVWLQTDSPSYEFTKAKKAGSGRIEIAAR